ncbi:hypothetical protein V8D89_001054 [Ganoderma adspersum]
MNPFPTGHPDSEKDTKIEAHLAPPPFGPPGYSAINQPPINVIPQDRPRNAYGRRFWHFLACTFLLLYTLYVVRNKHLNPTPSTAVGPDRCAGHVTWEKVSDVPSGYRAHLRTSVTFPVPENILSVIAEGARAHGTLEVSQTADAGSDAVVEVDVFYRIQEDFDQATVCRLHPANNEWGLGIFTPTSTWPPWHSDQLRFDVRLRLPAATSTSPLTVVELKTDLHNFSQQLRGLTDSVHIDKLLLKSTNGGIVAESVAGDDLELHTTNGAITGQFNTTSDLGLHATNGHIDARVSLLPSSHGGLVGPYFIKTETSNAAIDLAFVDAPLNHVLRASARSSNGRVAVTTHETFEGEFELRTSNASPPHVSARNVSDPAGLGRTRSWGAWGIGRTGYHGTVTWANETSHRGSVEAVTTNARVQLTL